MILVKDSKTDFIQGDYHDRHMGTTFGFCSKGEILGLTLNRTRENGNL